MRAATHLALGALTLATVACHEGAPMLTEKIDGKYRAGDVWKYRTHAGEEVSTLRVLRVETNDKLGTIVHISLDGLRIKNTRAPSGFVSHVDHLPLGEAAIDASVTERVSLSVGPSTTPDGYGIWRREFDRGKAGVFTTPVAEVVSFLESTSGQ